MRTPSSHFSTRVSALAVVALVGATGCRNAAPARTRSRDDGPKSVTTEAVRQDQVARSIDVVGTLCAILDEMRPLAGAASYRDQITYVKDRPGHDRRYAIDARKIGSELGWQPTETFESGLRRTVRWYLDHQAWVADVTSGAYREWIAKHYA